MRRKRHDYAILVSFDYGLYPVPTGGDYRILSGSTIRETTFAETPHPTPTLEARRGSRQRRSAERVGSRGCFWHSSDCRASRRRGRGHLGNISHGVYCRPRSASYFLHHEYSANAHSEFCGRIRLLHLALCPSRRRNCSVAGPYSQ